MLPLPLANVDEDFTIKKISGSPDVKKHLENLGFVVGGNVKIVAYVDGNLIVNAKEARIAINKELAMRVMV